MPGTAQRASSPSVSHLEQVSSGVDPHCLCLCQSIPTLRARERLRWSGPFGVSPAPAALAATARASAQRPQMPLAAKLVTVFLQDMHTGASADMPHASQRSLAHPAVMVSCRHFLQRNSRGEGATGAGRLAGFPPRVVQAEHKPVTSSTLARRSPQLRQVSREECCRTADFVPVRGRFDFRAILALGRGCF